MKKRKLLLITVMIVLIGAVFYLYNGFNGNPLSKYLAKHELKTYLQETYTDKEFTVSDGFYNFKVSGYEFTVTEIGSTDDDGHVLEYEFTVSGFINPKVYRDGIYEANLDHQLAKRLNDQIVEELSPLLKEKVETFYHMECYIEVLKGKYPGNLKWSKEIELEKPIAFFIQIDSTKQSAEEFFKASQTIKKIIDKEDYDYETIMINGIMFEEEEDHEDYFLKYSIAVDKGETLKKKDLEKHNEDLY